MENTLTPPKNRCMNTDDIITYPDQTGNLSSMVHLFHFSPDLQLSTRSSSNTTTIDRGIFPTESLCTWAHDAKLSVMVSIYCMSYKNEQVC